MLVFFTFFTFYAPFPKCTFHIKKYLFPFQIFPFACWDRIWFLHRFSIASISTIINLYPNSSQTRNSTEVKFQTCLSETNEPNENETWSCIKLDCMLLHRKGQEALWALSCHCMKYFTAQYTLVLGCPQTIFLFNLRILFVWTRAMNWCLESRSTTKSFKIIDQ